MKGFLLGIIFLFSIFNGIFAAGLKAYFSYATFYSPANGPYIETYLSVNGESIHYTKTKEGSYQGSLEITLLFKNGDEIKNFKKYNLLSPVVADTSLPKKNFLDLQRISLVNGTYEFEIIIKDNNSSEKPFKSVQLLEIDFSANTMQISEIEFFESMQKSAEKSMISKNGYDIVPFVSNYYPASIDKIGFYAEIYNSSKVLGADQKYLVNYYIESFETSLPFANYKAFSRQTTNEVNVVLNYFNITELPTGNYNLVIEARNRDNDLLVSKKVFFQRNNPQYQPILTAENIEKTFVENYSNRDTLWENICSLEPISTGMEISFARNQLKNGDLKTMKQFFLNFWLTRNETNPEEEWKKYKTSVEKVNKVYGTSIRKGYETDRGRTFLKYGEPNTISKQYNEPSAYPYEIWQYYKIKNFSNKRFIFYNTDLVSNDFELLHSDMVGEINDPNWKMKLHKRNHQLRDPYENDPVDHFGGRSDDFFKNPR